MDGGTVARELAQRMPQLVKNTVERVVDELPRHPEVGEIVAVHLECVVRALRGGEPEPAEVRLVVRANVDKLPLADLLRVHRIALAEAWQQVADITAGEHAALVAATGVLWRVLDGFADVAAEAYRDVTGDALREPMLDALFAGGAALDGALWDIARVLGLPVAGDYVVVAAEAPALGLEPLPHIESELAAAHLASAWRTSPDRRVGVVSTRSAGALDALSEVLRRNDSARVGVSPGYTGLDNTAKALHLALVALAGLAPGAVGVAWFGESPLAGLVASAPETSVRLAQQVLRPVLRLPGEDRQVLLGTLRAWFDCQGSAKLTAERMPCHPNTIRYRLKRIADELGRSLSDPADIAELGAALRALQAFPDQPSSKPRR